MNADQARAGPLERDTELAITALKKGTNLLKYGRRGKPKFCPFRLSNDESLLVWYSGNEEKQLKLSHVSRIIPGQRTPIFQRYPRPEKEYQSFSLLYSDRSLDLICKDKDEAEVWFTGLKALVSRYHRRTRADPRSGLSSEANSPKAQTQRSSPLSSPFGSADSSQKDGVDPLYPYESPQKNGMEKALSDAILYTIPAKSFNPQESASSSVHSFSSGGFDGLNGRCRGNGIDTFRVSLSSAVSSSSHGSGHDDGDALGDVYIWGEGTGDGILGGGAHRLESSLGVKLDSYRPKTLDSAVLLDVQNIACGGKHAALVTKQGEVFTWGEESGGRLGHGVDSDVSYPKLVDSLKTNNIELVACGENHSCAVSLSGDLYIWGGRKYGFGLPGQGNEMSHWIPKRLIGPLEGIHVSSISCGPWHTAIVTSAGQLFTFGDGTFGVLGHGDRKSFSAPREVESLKGLRTVRAACGVWHTAAVVEVMVGSSSSSNCSSGKLFTWGDGDKGRLGHGDKESKLVPTCVAALVEPNFCQVACGHSLTVALTTAGQVYTMGSPVYGQLGNPQADGKLPVRVDGKLVKSFVEEISCGAYHVAALTSRTEVFTWGKGANGRLGHGDTDDRNSPTIVESLKDKQVKSIACGTNFTSAVCLHKWVSGVDQSLCTGCRLTFNFKRKRHNCYNCGLVFCHSCSSRKSLKASMAPNPNKPYRVCDNCFGKLRKSIENDSCSVSSLSRRGSMNQRVNQNIENEDKNGTQSLAPFGKFSTKESFKDTESVSSRRNKKLEFNSSRVSPLPNGFTHWGALSTSKSGSSKKFFSASLPGSRIVSRATSPTSRRSSPPRAATPSPAMVVLSSPNKVVDDAKKTNDHLSQEVLKLRAQVEELTQKTQLQEVELEKTSKQLKEAIAIAGEETAKCKAAKEVIKSLTAQLKEMAERLPLGAVKNSKAPVPGSPGPNLSDVSNVMERLNSPVALHEIGLNWSNRHDSSNGSSTPSSRGTNNPVTGQLEASSKNKNRTSDGEANYGSEWVEQDEPGVYITLVSLPEGTKDLKRVRFRVCCKETMEVVRSLIREGFFEIIQWFPDWGKLQNIRYQLQVPLFDGRNLEEWILEIEDFFHLFWLSEEEKFGAACVALDGEAWRWFGGEHLRRPLFQWVELKVLLVLRFGSSPELWPAQQAPARFGNKGAQQVTGGSPGSLTRESELVGTTTSCGGCYREGFVKDGSRGSSAGGCRGLDEFSGDERVIKNLSCWQWNSRGKFQKIQERGLEREVYARSLEEKPKQYNKGKIVKGLEDELGDKSNANSKEILSKCTGTCETMQTTGPTNSPPHPMKKTSQLSPFTIPKILNLIVLNPISVFGPNLSPLTHPSHLMPPTLGPLQLITPHLQTLQPTTLLLKPNQPTPSSTPPNYPTQLDTQSKPSHSHTIKPLKCSLLYLETDNPNSSGSKSIPHNSKPTPSINFFNLQFSTLQLTTPIRQPNPSSHTKIFNYHFSTLYLTTSPILKPHNPTQSNNPHTHTSHPKQSTHSPMSNFTHPSPIVHTQFLQITLPTHSIKTTTLHYLHSSSPPQRDHDHHSRSRAIRANYYPP